MLNKNDGGGGGKQSITGLVCGGRSHSPTKNCNVTYIVVWYLTFLLFFFFF